VGQGDYDPTMVQQAEPAWPQPFVPTWGGVAGNGFLNPQLLPPMREPIRALNGNVAVEPFAPIEKRVETKGGVTQLQQAVTLYPSKVIFGGDKFRTGDIVYVKAETVKLATTSFTAEGQTFVLIPETAVIVVHEKSPR
jgi:hypothetical protein